jgi:RHS repeat-associated protein
VQVQASGYFPVHRQVPTQWHQYAAVDDIWLTPPDPNANTISLNAASYQAAQGSTIPTAQDTVNAATATRTARVLFPPNTGANLTYGPCGTCGTSTCTTGTCDTSTNLCTGPAPSTLTIRATEYTVGPNGPASMPAQLPANSAYTYAVELSADEAIEAGATGVAFTSPVAFYVDNFLGFPSNTPVPAGYYNVVKGQWVPLEDGRVIEITSFQTGASNCSGYSACAVIDSADQALLNLSAGELSQLAETYGAETTPLSAWRVAMNHFSPNDLNWTPPIPLLPTPAPAPTPYPPPALPNSCHIPGSIIECENQILAEELPVAGTPFALRYQSDRAPGRTPTINIPLVGPDGPGSFTSVGVTIGVAGVTYNQVVTAPFTPNQVLTWTWNRLDAFGNVVQGVQQADIKLTYYFAGDYILPPAGTVSGSFGTFGQTVTGSGASRTILDHYGVEFFIPIGVEDTQPLGFGGWAFNANHVYDSATHTLWRGDGKRSSVVASSVIDTVAGSACGSASGDNGPALNAIFEYDAMRLAVGPDGSYYVADYSENYPGDLWEIRKVSPSGVVTSIEGNVTTFPPSCLPEAGTTCPEAEVGLLSPLAIAVGPDSSVYLATEQFTTATPLYYVIQRIDPSGCVSVIAGSPAASDLQSATCLDNAVGTSGTLGYPTGLAVAPDGTVLIADNDCGVRAVRTDGSLLTLSRPSPSVPGGSSCAADTNGDNGPLGLACVTPFALAVAADGSIFVSDVALGNQTDGISAFNIVRRIDGKTGIIQTYAGFGGPASFSGLQGFSGCPAGETCSLPATSVSLGTINALAVASDGTLYMTDGSLDVLWRVDTSDVISVAAGCTFSSCPGGGSLSNGPAQYSGLFEPVGLGIGPNGSIYLTDETCRVRAVTSPFPGYQPGSGGVIDTYVPSEDGGEVYGFDNTGLHIATFDPTTGAMLLSFGYDLVTQQLTSVVDVNGNTTTISRSGSTVSITPPFGQATSSQQTVLTLDSTGHATSITDPAGETTQCTYSNGLLTSLETPAGYLHQFAYDAQGSLLTDQDPTGATQTLARTMTTGGGVAGISYVPGENWNVAVTSGAGHTTTHATSTSANGLVTQTTTSPSGAMGSYSQSASDIRIRTSPDGTVTTATALPDPRFGMLDPYPGTVSVQTPSGLLQTTTRARSASGPTLAPTMMTESVTVNGIQSSSSTYVSTASDPAWTHISAMGRTSQETLDSQGRLIGISFPGSQLAATTLTYGATGGRLSSVTAAAGTTTRQWSMTYDSPGLPGYVATTVDPMGNTTTFAERDNTGRPTNVLLADFSSSPSSQYSVTYDKDGNTTSLTVPPATSLSSQHNFSSNSLDSLGVYEPPPDGLTSSQTSYAYNADRLIQSVTVPVGTPATESIAYGYDAFGRLQSILDPSSGVTRQFTYNPHDQVATLARSDGSTLTYTYDGFLKTSATLSGNVSGSVSWTYDNFLRVAQRSVNAGSPVVYTYDNDNLYTGTSSPVFSVARDYSNAGRIASTALGSVTDTQSYDSFSELATYVASTALGTPYQLAVASRDPNGRILEMTETVNGSTHSWSFAYDSRGRLTSASRDLVTNTYTYDPNGNRRTMNGSADWFYDSQDRLLSNPSGVAFTYRNDGTATTKVTSAGTYGYSYDLTGFLQSVSLPSGSLVQYTADARNRRIGRSLASGSSTISQQFVYDNQLRVAAELGNSGATVTSVFVYGTKPNVPDYMIQGTATYRVISDWLGSVRLVVNAATGAVVQQLDYDEFGNVLPSSFDTTCAADAQCFPFQPFGFAGGLQDRDTGLVRFGARDYDPQIGRWISKDPSRFGGGLNFYVYADGDPVNELDSDGLNVAPSDNLLGSLVHWLSQLSSSLSSQADQALSSGNYSASAELGAESAGAGLLAVLVEIAPTVASFAVITGGGFICGGVDSATLPPGDNPNVFVVPTEADLQSLYQQLSAGGTPVQNSYPGSMVELPDGTLVGIRPQSSSGGATIDVNQGGTQYKVHIGP